MKRSVIGKHKFKCLLYWGACSNSTAIRIPWSEKADSDKISATNLPHGLDNPFRLSSDKLLLNASQPSVFANPFKTAEEAEKSALEKHVKLAPKREDMKEINGKKICWNYRKGRCRFGSNCIYAHDELLRSEPEHQSVGHSHSATSLYKSKIVGKERKRKFKPHEVVPPEKVMKSFVE